MTQGRTKQGGLGVIDQWLRERLAREDFEERFGIPLLMADLDPTHAGLVASNAQNQTATPPTEDELNGFMRGMIVPTCGNLFRGVDLSDGRYPIPPFPDMPKGSVLDIGCNWGRWSIAAALAGHRVVGVDVHLLSLLVAQQVARKLVPHNMPQFVLADARSLPFRDGAFDNVFSYSVIQHFSRPNARTILEEVGRVLKPGGEALVQMPNKAGVKAIIAGDVRRNPDVEFNIRYYGVDELLELFRTTIGPSSWQVDCFLGLKVLRRDRWLAPRSLR
ncbi:MAG: hypothetical protein JWM33_2889, partial [Caulobacteraceae bacterium]|nr:hypothetical protein [Caulobacteraceae bacterium]